jgi:hypothetical protein
MCWASILIQMVTSFPQHYKTYSHKIISLARLRIYDNTLTRTQGTAIFFGGGTDQTDIQSNRIHYSQTNGIAVTTAFSGTDNSNIRARYNSFQGNKTSGITIDTGAYDATQPNQPFDATNNWWASKSGPSGIGPGTGEEIFASPNEIEFIPFLTRPPSDPR